MDQIRPIGPRERDIEPVFHTPRASPDGGRERPDPREGQPRREPRPAPVEPPDPERRDGDGGEGGSLIDVRV
jgi:hypothetical protein